MNVNTRSDLMKTEDIKISINNLNQGQGFTRDQLEADIVPSLGTLMPLGESKSNLDQNDNFYGNSDAGYSSKIQKNKKISKDRKIHSLKPLAMSSNENDATDRISNIMSKKESVIQAIEESFKFTNKRKMSLPPVPKKQLAMSFCLLLVGLIGLLIGTIYAVESNNPNSGIAFWVIGCLCGLPGLFYVIKFCKVCYASSAEGRRKALEEIPQE